MSAPQADPLLAWLDDYPVVDCDRPDCIECKPMRALRLEVEAHHWVQRTSDSYGSEYEVCEDCEFDWPCPTRRRIAAALGVEL